MTRAQALDEARRRWGDRAWVILRRRPRRFVVGTVGAYPNNTPNPLGASSESWEAAFADAERPR